MRQQQRCQRGGSCLLPANRLSTSGSGLLLRARKAIESDTLFITQEKKVGGGGGEEEEEEEDPKNLYSAPVMSLLFVVVVILEHHPLLSIIIFFGSSVQFQHLWLHEQKRGALQLGRPRSARQHGVVGECFLSLSLCLSFTRDCLRFWYILGWFLGIVNSGKTNSEITSISLQVDLNLWRFEMCLKFF